MDSAFKLQMDVRNNAEELQKYVMDLQNWEEEMKKKDHALKNGKTKPEDIPPPRNTIKRNNSEKEPNKKKSNFKTNKPKKIRAYDYAAWDKYDVDKACDELDKDQCTDEEDESNTSQSLIIEEKKEEEKCDAEKITKKNIDEAFFEKERGNEWVKKEKWEEAIKCYSNAIELDPRNPIYYANRALCSIKLKNFKAAEVDSTIAIQLDNTYVKAFQRRAFARTALGQLQEAKSDYEALLKLEPNNAFANMELSKIDAKLKNSNVKTELPKPIFNAKSIFKSENKVDGMINKQADVKKKDITVVGDESSKEKKLNVAQLITSEEKVKPKEKIKKEIEDNVFGRVPEGFSIVKSIHIPPHLRSRRQLRKIPIKTVFTDAETLEDFLKLSNSEPVTDKEAEVNLVKPAIAIREEQPDLSKLVLHIPETCIQFQNTWKLVKREPQYCYLYLKKINPEALPNIFKHSLESDLLSELITCLSTGEFVKDPDFVYTFLYNLTRVQRFGSLSLFMSPSDVENLQKCIKHLESAKTESELEALCRLYEVQRPK